MRFVLTVTDGPNAGQNFAFAERDNFIVGRSAAAHFQPDKKDRFFSRYHFLVEINPPLGRLIDLGSNNGTQVNDKKVPRADLKGGDKIRAGKTELTVRIEPDPADKAAGRAPEAAIAIDPDPTTAFAIPGHRVVGEIGRGGIGVVYLARADRDGAQVAVKIITPVAATTRRNIDRFVTDAGALKQLVHPNVVAVRDVGVVAGRLYLTMDYFLGTDAGRLVKERGPLPVPSAVRTAIEVLRALEHAHSQNLVHRDIKPSNILMRPDNKAHAIKLTDFGLARLYQSSPLSGLSRDAALGGTPAFLPPEQVTAHRTANPASDLFAVGATLYFLLTGKPIHDFDTDSRPPLALVLEGDPIPIRDRRSEIPEGLATAIHRSLARDPAKRFGTSAEFVEALRAYRE
ncbi:MAG TPA: protein kinase [Gemmataceae bacterium]|nr:protein kinase [Gemmataceae bacterium]